MQGEIVRKIEVNMSDDPEEPIEAIFTGVWTGRQLELAKMAIQRAYKKRNLEQRREDNGRSSTDTNTDTRRDKPEVDDNPNSNGGETGSTLET